MIRSLCATLTLLALGAMTIPAASQEVHPDLTAGRLRFQLLPDSGARLTVDDVPVIYESTLYLMPPGWSGSALLNASSDTPTVATTTEGDVKVVTADYDTPDASAKYRYELHPGNTFRVRMTYAGKGKPGIVQYWAGLLNANLLAGAPFKAVTVDGPREGTVPLFATSSDQTASKLTPNVRNITFDTVLGRMEISVEGTDNATQSLTLFDSRLGTADWAKKNPAFWLGIGVPDPEITPGEHTVTITYRFGMPIPKQTIPAAEGAAKTLPVESAVVPFKTDIPVIPRPKLQRPGPARPFRIDGKTKIVIREAPSTEEKQAARELQAELKAYWGVSVPIVRSDRNAVAPAPGNISLAPVKAISKLSTSTARIKDKPEGYHLAVYGQTITIQGADVRGIYYGAQTLKQLFRVDDKGVYIDSTLIEDWPSLKFRGVHWFGGPKSWPFHERMISRIIAPLKMNAMVYQADYTQWETQPKVWSAERSTPKADVRKTVNHARAHFLEPIPMVNGMGHAEWLFWNGQNLDIAADPSKPYAYNPEKPRSYDVLFPIMQEAIDLFKPKYFHIGNDEVTMTGKFPPEGVNKSVTQLVLEDTNRRHDWLRARGIKTMMWGDMFLYRDEASDAAMAHSKEEAAERRAGIPRDIIIADWHYQGARPEFPSVALWQKEGFQVVGTTWYDWGNIEKFARVLNAEKSMGFLQSTWAGYAMSMDVLKGAEFRQFVAYLLGAEYAWNGGGPTIAELGYSPDDAFLSFWNRKPVSMARQSGFTVNLSGLSNAGMWDWIPAAESGAPKGADKPFPTGRATFGGVVFETGNPVWLAGALNPAGVWPKQVTIPLDGLKAADLHFLWATTFATPAGTTVGTVRVTYTDGTTAQMPVVYGREIYAFNDLRSGAAAIIGWRGQTPFGETAAARRTVWENPNPNKPIRSVTLVSAETQAAPVLLGLTGVPR